METKAAIRPIDILLVEDNPGDIDLAREALELNKLYNSSACCAGRRCGHGFSPEDGEI